jgi:hypothetical protein
MVGALRKSGGYNETESSGILRREPAPALAAGQSSKNPIFINERDDTTARADA